VIDFAELKRDPAEFARRIARKGASREGVERALALDARRLALLRQVEDLRSRQNAASREIAAAKKSGASADALLAEMKSVKEKERELSERLAAIEAEVDGVLRLLPNPPDDDVPDGKAAEDNREIARWGTPPEFDFAPKAHWDLGLLDMEAGGRMSGSGFPVLKGDGARLERALGQFLLDLAGRHGYAEVSPPLLLREEVMDGVTIREKFRDDMYLSEKDGLYLLPTAEHPLTNLHRDQVLDAASLPLRYTALTPCFRREAGAAGKDTRGLLRVHQFWKVEMMSFTAPEQSKDEHERMLGNARAALEALGIPHRVVFVCTGDMSMANRRQYDLEAWAAGVGRWLEVSSVSNFGDWQARRCGTRCKSGKEKPRVAHTLNGSALGMPRTLVAILENGQREDGSISVPGVLQRYMDGRTSLGPP